MKEIPKVYVNPLEKNISNNDNYSYGKLMDRSSIRDERELLNKINDMNFNTDYKIKFKDYSKVYNIIGKTSNNLVCSDGGLIKISDIYDILEI